MHCLVTGGSGYLGRALMPALRQRSVRVHALAHRDADLPMADTVVRGDLSDPARAVPLDGIDVVVHLAGIAHQRADARAYRRLNVDGTVALARQAVNAGVERFIFVSSVKAQRASAQTGGDEADRDYDLGYDLDYGTSKLLAEQALQEVCAGSAMRLFIVRPALIYDTELTGHLQWLQRWVSLGLPRPPAGGARSMVGRADLVALLVALLRTDVTLAQPVIATDGQQYSTRRLHAALVRASGRNVRLPSPPAASWRFAAACVDRLRGEPVGALWQRLTGEERYEGDDLSGFLNAAPQTFEEVLGLRQEDAP